MRRYLIPTLVLAALTSACASMPPAETTTVATGNELQPGDSVKITVYGQGQLSGEQVVDEDGNVTVPLAGRVKLAGQTPSEAEATLRNRIAGRIVVDPSVAIEVTRRRPVYVLGEVGKPGAYDWEAGMRVMNAVALAGGYTYRAKVDQVEVRRARDPNQEAYAVTDTTRVMPGDTIVVRERWY